MLTNGAAIQRINEVAHVRFLHHRGVIPTRATRKGVQQTLVKVGIQCVATVQQPGQNSTERNRKTEALRLGETP
jgi:hypothetical protein